MKTDLECQAAPLSPRIRSPRPPPSPRAAKGPTNAFLLLLKATVILASASLVLSRIAPLFFSRLGIFHHLKHGPIKHWTLRFHVAVLCLLFAFVEWDATFVPTHGFLGGYAERGFLQSFVGWIEVDDGSNVVRDEWDKFRNDDVADRGKIAALATMVRNVSSRTLVATGVVYFVLGLISIESLRDMCRDHAERRKRRYEK